jgi:hypothetical protein
VTKRSRRLLTVALAVCAAVAATVTASAASPDRFGDRNAFRAQLNGYEEFPLAISTGASGQFRALINEDAGEIAYRLSYTVMESGDVTQAHIHFGADWQNGGISVFLCSNLGNGPAGTQACPPAPATISGTIRPADVIGPAGQGIAPGEFAELLRAMRAGFTYANVHTTGRPAGEVRGELGHH